MCTSENTHICISGIRPHCGGVNLPKWASSCCWKKPLFPAIVTKKKVFFPDFGRTPSPPPLLLLCNIKWKNEPSQSKMFAKKKIQLFPPVHQRRKERRHKGGKEEKCRLDKGVRSPPSYKKKKKKFAQQRLADDVVVVVVFPPTFRGLSFFRCFFSKKGVHKNVSLRVLFSVKMVVIFTTSFRP